MLNVLLVSFAFVAVMLAGCTASPVFQPMVDIGKAVVPNAPARQSGPRLNPAYRYLRVVVFKQQVFFVLGYVEASKSGPIEVWYSHDKEVLKLLNGRVIAALGTPTQWLSAQVAGAPAWGDGLDGVEYERSLDISPGYRYGVHQRLRLRRIPPPADNTLVGVNPNALVWYREESVGASALPPALYAVAKEGSAWQVVYSEVCLDAKLCFSWQRWQP